MNIVCFGDSITYAKPAPEGDRWPTALHFDLNTWCPDHYPVFNRGIGGDTTAQGLERFPSEVMPLLPGMVLIEFGFNDANVRTWSRIPRVGLSEYRENLAEFARVLKENDSIPVFIINHTITRGPKLQGNGRAYLENFKPYQTALREVAATAGASIIDLPAIMREREVDLDRFLLDDGLHLSVYGNRLYAEMIGTRLKEILA